jgi:hypothetical protein
MKRFWLFLILVIPCASFGQQYQINWFKVAGGGGASTGSGYTLNGTIGQDDAGGPMTGGGYTLSGGFWNSATAVGTPAEPGLTIARTATNTVVISWPAPAPGWVLLQTPTLVGGSWTNVNVTLVQVGGRLQVVQPLLAGSRFYRLMLVPAPPTLFLTRSGSNVILSWSTNATGFTLESKSDLTSPSSWLPVLPTPTTVNGFNYVTNAVTPGNNFYRLRWN